VLRAPSTDWYVIAPEKARGTPYSKVLNSYEKSYIILIIRVICVPLHLMAE